MSLDGLTQTLRLDGVMALAQRAPGAAALLLLVVVVLGVLIRQAQLDTRREAAILRSRELMQLMAERASRTMTAESLRDDLRQLQAALASDIAWAAKPASVPSSDLQSRLARLTAISEMLSRDLAARAMWDTMMERQMAAWQRRQRVWSAGMGLATVAVGGLLPVLLSSVA